MAQPVNTESYDGNSIVLSEWKVDGNGVLATGIYTKGAVLGKNLAGNYELTTDATKAEAILLEDTVVTAATANAPIVMGGEVAEEDLNYGGALTADDVRDSLRDKNIYLKKRG